MIHKTKEYRLWQKHNHISKRKRICNQRKAYATVKVSENKYKLDYSREIPFEWYEHDGQYNKGKIHCSCGICKFSRKYHLPTLRDIKEKEHFKADLQDYYVSA